MRQDKRIPAMVGIVMILLVVVGLPNVVSAQLSPGKLSSSHSHLEGIKNCTRCHDLGKKSVQNNCLHCHTLLGERIEAGKGLHARAEYRDCHLCHNEHHGEDFELIHWEGGQKAFPHPRTGWPLEGKHASAACRDCHQSRNVQDGKRLLARKKSLSRTFLGLTQECLACHADEHRGQLADRCLDCHDLAGWRPAPNFRHDRARFALEGKHMQVTCERCHPGIFDEETGTHHRTFRGIAFASCTDCHQDRHRGRLGNDCLSCHSASSWQVRDAKGFDHTRTRYPLQGRHSSVACAACHKAGDGKRALAFGLCTDCHTDFHLGEVVGAEHLTRCEDCHSVAGFVPASFTIAEHDSTGFPLHGAHLATPCIACHPHENPDQTTATVSLHIQVSGCRDCHRDPHGQAVVTFQERDGCVACHVESSWIRVAYDHARTAFPLEGKHRQARCSSCHLAEESVGQDETWQFVAVSRVCQSCHEDRHRGQFAAAGTVVTAVTAGTAETTCDRCHTPVDWFAERFDHDHDSRFVLGKGHQNVHCEKCHVSEMWEGQTIVRYKPLDMDCRSCHAGDIALTRDGGE